jgi:hypothetical protein
MRTEQEIFDNIEHISKYKATEFKKITFTIEDMRVAVIDQLKWCLGENHQGYFCAYCKKSYRGTACPLCQRENLSKLEAGNG